MHICNKNKLKCLDILKLGQVWSSLFLLKQTKKEVRTVNSQFFLEPDGHPFINGCFNWMIQNLYIGNGCFTKHPFKTGCLGFQVVIAPPNIHIAVQRWEKSGDIQSLRRRQRRQLTGTLRGDGAFQEVWKRGGSSQLHQLHSLKLT